MPTPVTLNLETFSHCSTSHAYYTSYLLVQLGEGRKLTQHISWYLLKTLKYPPRNHKRRGIVFVNPGDLKITKSALHNFSDTEPISTKKSFVESLFKDL